MLSRLERLAVADPQMVPLQARCRLGLAACLLCQQEIDQARPFFLALANALELNPSLLKAADRGLLGQGLAQLGELSSADKILPAEFAERFRKGLRGSTLRLIPECGHLPQQECPESVSTALFGPR